MMELTIFETSDIHGFLYPTDYFDGDNQNLGLFKIASLYKNQKETLQGPSILIDNGDILQGSLLSYYLERSFNDSEMLMNAMNELNYDAGIIGNHEFNYGLDYLNKAISQANYPVLSANILNIKDAEPFTQAYKIVEKEGLKIAILGLTTQYIPYFEHPDNYKGLSFQSAVEVAKKYVPWLKEKADIVIVSYHGGFEYGLRYPLDESSNDLENEGNHLLEEVPGIDVLLTGHQHQMIAEVYNGIPIVMPRDKGQYLGKVLLSVDKDSNQQWQITDAKAELLPVDQETEVDSYLSEKYIGIHKEVNQWLDQEIGRLDISLVVEDSHQARIEEHPYVELINKIQMYYSGADISATSLFSEDTQGLRENVSIRDVLSSYKFPNTLVVLEVTGDILKRALERTAEYFVVEDGIIGISPDWLEPKRQLYNYDMYEGIDYVIDVSKPLGERVVKFEKDGKAIQPTDKLNLVLNHYRAVGGGDYLMFTEGNIIKEIKEPVPELIIDYMSKFKNVETTCNHNFKVINS